MHSLFESNLHIAEYVPFGLIIAIIIFTTIGWSIGLYRLRKYGQSGAVIRDSLATAIFGLPTITFFQALGYSLNPQFAGEKVTTWQLGWRDSPSARDMRMKTSTLTSASVKLR